MRVFVVYRFFGYARFSLPLPLPVLPFRFLPLVGSVVVVVVVVVVIVVQLDASLTAVPIANRAIG